MRYLIRVFVLPFVAMLSLVGLLIMWIKYIINFILYGGEFIVYTNNDETKTIQDIYNKLSNKNEI